MGEKILNLTNNELEEKLLDYFDKVNINSYIKNIITQHIIYGGAFWDLHDDIDMREDFEFR
jgi:hypothetical protein